MDGRNYKVSVVDAGNIVVFIHAEELGLKGMETPGRLKETVIGCSLLSG